MPGSNKAQQKTHHCRKTRAFVFTGGSHRVRLALLPIQCNEIGRQIENLDLPAVFKPRHRQGNRKLNGRLRRTNYNSLGQRLGHPRKLEAELQNRLHKRH